MEKLLPLLVFKMLAPHGAQPHGMAIAKKFADHGHSFSNIAVIRLRNMDEDEVS